MRRAVLVTNAPAGWNGWVRLHPARVHGHDDERWSFSRDNAGGCDCANATDSDLVASHPGYRTDLLEPLDLDPVRQLHDHRPTVVQILEAALPPARAPHVRIPMLLRTGIDSVDDLGRRHTCLLQQGDIGVHVHKLAPRLSSLGDVPTDDRRSHSDLSSRLAEFDLVADPVWSVGVATASCVQLARPPPPDRVRCFHRSDYRPAQVPLRAAGWTRPRAVAVAIAPATPGPSHRGVDAALDENRLTRSSPRFSS